MAVSLRSVPMHTMPLYAAPSHIDAINVDDVRADLDVLAAEHPAIAIDCSHLSSIAGAGMRALEQVAHTTEITLVDPTPIVRLMIAVFGLDVDVRVRHGHAS